MERLKTLLKSNIPIEQKCEYIVALMEQKFEDGQASGTRIAKQISMYKQRRRNATDKAKEELFDDAVQLLFNEMLDALPCNKSVRRLGKCPLRHTAMHVFDTYKGTFSERLNTIIAKLSEEKND